MTKEHPVIHNIMTRRSIRSFDPQSPVEEKDLQTLLQCLQAAPSAGNLQPWRFHVVRSAAKKEELCRLSFDQKAVREAPVVFVITAVPHESAVKYGELGATFFCLQDTAAAAQNLMLAAHALDYGSLWVGVVKEREIAAALQLDAGEKPIALIAVGRRAEEPGPYERKSILSVTTFVDE
jgi:nitroreductase